MKRPNGKSEKSIDNKLKLLLDKKTTELEQARRELQIESTLERVRSVAMGMKKPEDMLDVCKTIAQQLALLNVKEIRNVQTAIFYEEKKTYTNYEFYAKHDKLLVTEVKYNDHQVAEEFAKRMLGGANQVWVHGFTGEEVKEWLNYQRGTNVFIDSYLETADSLTYYWSSLGPVAMGTSTYVPLKEEEIELFKRFRNVFELAYRRYLDIEKAEAQAREAQIEAALEKVRGRSLAMHKSDELLDVVKSVFDRLDELKVELNSAIIIIFLENSKDMIWWLINRMSEQFSRVVVKYQDLTYFRDLYAMKENGKELLTKTYPADKKLELFNYLFEQTDFKNVPEERKQFILGSKFFTISTALAKNTAIQITSYSKNSFSDDENEMLKRFVRVFDQSYTRFLDLQKAEAQAREARIEASLERTRTQSMLMQHSKELDDTLRVFHEQVLLLGINSAFSFLWLPDEEKDRHIFWAVWAENNSKIFRSKAINYPLDRKEPATAQCLVDWKANQPVISYHVPPVSVDNYFATWQELIAGVDHLKPERFKDGLYYVEAFMKYGCFGIMVKNEVLEEEKKILERFAIEFERAYTRFLDLQKAEAQTREALIEGALERVRARALAMQQPEELKEVAQVLRNEMGALGVEELETSSIYIHGESSENVECWYALQDPKHAEKKMVADYFILNLNDTWVGKEMKKFYLSNEKQTSIVMKGANRREWIEYCYKHSPVFSGFYGETIPDRTYHLYKFSHGYIGAAAPGDISAESWKLLSRAASVFSLAYSRFRDLTQAQMDLIKLKEEKKRAEDALTELQATQKQLIQSEKMASLGELTAGIAHEIQNPLNFVNNFSEVSNELIDEMKQELATGNQQLATEIANDIKQNLEKINHHGKRADAIVKSMLQHSRSSSGKKEPTDINALCDEYLRLAFHGLRAKDKSFNAKFEIELDPDIGQVNIIAQDIGRVILNLINNAFYAVSEKKNHASKSSPAGGYEPVVIVKTKKLNNAVEIKVADNGGGMPQKVLDKIFQPFFTTKPTGQGTGLGLSLAYDIITKGHGGELKVETKEGEGSEFIIQIPMN